MSSQDLTLLLDRWWPRIEAEPDPYMQHLLMVRFVLGEPLREAMPIAHRFADRPLTREEAEGLVADWAEEGWGFHAA